MSTAASEHALEATTPDDQGDPSTQAQLPPTDGGHEAKRNLIACCIMQLPCWGFAMTYGVFQEYYTNPNLPSHLKGNISSIGTVGTTLNGIIYLSMPILFGLLARRLAWLRVYALSLGAILSIVSIVASAFVNTVTGLIATQGVLQAFGSTLLYTASTVYLDEWWIQRKGFAYGMILSSKSAVGVALPLIVSALLRALGLRITLLIWAGVLAATILPGFVLLKPRIVQNITITSRRYRRTSWAFLKHRTFPTYAVANIIFATSYGIPQTYLSEFASDTFNLTSTQAATMLVAMNVPSIAASYWFGTMGDGEKSKIFGNRRPSVAAVSCVSALGSALPILMLWGLTPSTPYAVGIVLLTLFSVTYGFFAGGYSATWGGVLQELRREADTHDEVVDTGLVVGLMNGTRGLGFIVSGLVSVELLKIGEIGRSVVAYGGNYGGLIVFSGCGAAMSGLGVLIRSKRR